MGIPRKRHLVPRKLLNQRPVRGKGKRWYATLSTDAASEVTAVKDRYQTILGQDVSNTVLLRRALMSLYRDLRSNPTCRSEREILTSISAMV
jgi:hypothetical protein